MGKREHEAIIRIEFLFELESVLIQERARNRWSFRDVDSITRSFDDIVETICFTRATAVFNQSWMV